MCKPGEGASVEDADASQADLAATRTSWDRIMKLRRTINTLRSVLSRHNGNFSYLVPSYARRDREPAIF